MRGLSFLGPQGVTRPCPRTKKRKVKAPWLLLSEQENSDQNRADQLRASHHADERLCTAPVHTTVRAKAIRLNFDVAMPL